MFSWSGSGLGEPKIEGPGTSVGAGSGGLSLRESEPCSSEGQAACGVETRPVAGLARMIQRPDLPAARPPLPPAKACLPPLLGAPILPIAFCCSSPLSNLFPAQKVPRGPVTRKKKA